ncbi:hypothetical protein H8F24_07495 [Synechococcus sp. CBW1002]|uniref:hypothetical protein n=1 Tax=unclassified Synechococcus TaxID=2626047 RepID=UPI0018CDAB60|nr:MULTISPECIES: hypothetical protein [unclassified Synechococcus]QPN61110.1 hypothetical protein H8F24_07495 [Synechococcus sp. CBW1002]QPN67235.1 hypothetical protein H8F26_03050 [Synechococcus sp. CBW1006]
MTRSALLPNPLDDPAAVAIASVALVLLVRLGLLPLAPALAVAALFGWGLATLRHRRRHRGSRLLDARLRLRIDAALARCRELAGQAALVGGEAMARFQDAAHLEALGLVQLCCERLQSLPERIEQRRPLLESGGGVLLSAEDLQRRLRQEETALRREEAGPLRLERQRLVEQLRRNLEAAEQGMDEREARLVALSTRLEQIDGGLRHLRRQVDRQWPSSQATDAAMAEALRPLDAALDQIERLLDEGSR